MDLGAGCVEGVTTVHNVAWRKRIAAKRYLCDACEWWRASGLTLDDCETDEQREAVRKAEAAEWSIHPGEQYIYARGVESGEFYSYRGRPDMDEVCRDLDLWRDCD